MKPLPNAPESERDILTTALTIPEATETIFSNLSTNDFYATAHQTLFQILYDLHRQGRPLDISIVKDGLTPEQAKHITPLVFDSILNGPPCISVDHSIGLIKGMTFRRKAIELSYAVAKAANDLQRPITDIGELAARIAVKPQLSGAGLRVINAAEWLRSEPPEPDQVLEDMLDAGDKMVVIASSKQRKSFFFQQLAISIAAGRDFLCWHVPKPRRVLYVQFEIREHHSHRRTIRLARAMGIDPDDLGDRLLMIAGRGKKLTGADGLDRLLKAVGNFKPEVIMLDPLYKITEGVENAAEDFKVILNAFDVLAEDRGAAIIFVHHDTKGAAGDKDIRDRGAGRYTWARL